MGDLRFEQAYAAIIDATDRLQAIRATGDEALIEALSAASRHADPLLANILATEAQNRMQRLRGALACMTEGVAALGRDAHIQWINPAGERLLGHPRSDVIGQNFHELIEHHDGDGQLIPHETCPLLLAMGTGEPLSREGELFVGKDGNPLGVAYTVAPIFGPRSEVAGAVLVFSDFSARKHREDALIEARERYQSLFESLPLAVISLDTAGTILDSNRAASTLMKREPRDSHGHVFTSFLNATDIPTAVELFGEIIRGESRSAEFTVARGDRSVVRVHATGVPILTSGRVTGVHCIVRPVGHDAGSLPPEPSPHASVISLT